jgi:hypothetical protein
MSIAPPGGMKQWQVKQGKISRKTDRTDKNREELKKLKWKQRKSKQIIIIGNFTVCSLSAMMSFM